MLRAGVPGWNFKSQISDFKFALALKSVNLSEAGAGFRRGCTPADEGPAANLKSEI
jgi:hypothetical protein